MSLALSLFRVFCYALVAIMLPVLAMATPEATPATGELCVLPALETALSQYRQLAAQGGWPQVPDGPTLHEGDRNDRIPLLRKRLVASTDLATTADLGDHFDGVLKRRYNGFRPAMALPPMALSGQEPWRS